MPPILSVTLPIFLLIGLGFAAVRFDAMSGADSRSLGVFVLRFALPALVFRALAQRPFAEIAHLDFLGVYALASLAIFGLAFALAFRARRDLSAAAIQALGSSSSNSGFVGYPVLLLFLGQATASVALALAMVVENLLIIPLALTLAESGARRGGGRLAREVARRLATNPLLIGIVAGALVSLSGLTLPEVLARPVDLLANASTALSLFAVGGGLVGLRPSGVAGSAARITVGKLIGHPLAVAAALWLAPGLDAHLEQAMLIVAGAPMLGVYPLLARPYGEEETASAALLMATAGSFVTLTALLALGG